MNPQKLKCEATIYGRKTYSLHSLKKNILLPEEIYRTKITKRSHKLIQPLPLETMQFVSRSFAFR